MQYVQRGILALGTTVLIATSVSATQMPALPAPGPEHEILKMDAGTWDALVETTAPDGSTVTSKGVETNRMGCGGLCLISDFTGEMMPGAQFQGHGMTTYDRNKKRYVGSWTDSMSTGQMISEGTYDANSKQFTATMEGPGMTGEPAKMRVVSEYKDADHRTMTMYATGPDGDQRQVLKISYTRRK